jgi:hypothetical protein
MDLGTLIIGVVLIVMAFLPIVVVSFHRKNKEKAMLQSLTQVANQQQSILSKHEYFGDFIIGIDEQKHVIFYVKKAKEKLIEAIVNLSDMKDCSVLNVSKTIKSKDGNYTIVDRLDLSFTPKEKNKAGVQFAFYHSDSNNQINEELKSAENWSRIVKDQLKSMASGTK